MIKQLLEICKIVIGNEVEVFFRILLGGELFILDGGYYIVDCVCLMIFDLEQFVVDIVCVFGVVEYGIFLRFVIDVIVGYDNFIEVLLCMD